MGAVFVGASFNVMLTVAVPLSPWLSVAHRVMIWFPALNEAIKESPMPIGPSMFEAHAKEFPESWPSWASKADPVKVMLSEVRKVWLAAGALMEATGRELKGVGELTETLMEAVSKAPALSFTLRVMMWSPSPREASKGDPMPI